MMTQARIPGAWRLALTALAFATAAAGTAGASIVPDAAGDFLTTFQGAQGGDLDVLGVEVLLDPGEQTITLVAQLAAAVGTTPGGFYVWGLDRGRGTAGFAGSDPNLSGVLFDSVLILRPDGTGAFNDFIDSTNSRPSLPAGSITVAGSTLSATFSTSFFAPVPNGRPIAEWGFNLWPRATFAPDGVTRLAGFAAISDFAPDTTTFGPTVVPEPPAWALAAIGLLAGPGLARWRRRRGA